MLELDPATGYLPPGDHLATLDEVVQAFGSRSYRRRQIAEGLVAVVLALVAKGVEEIWIDGSFVTDRARPNDVDVVYVPPGGADISTWGLLSPARRNDLKKFRRVDLWDHPSPQRRVGGFGSVPLVEWFRTDRSGVEKGHVRLDMEAIAAEERGRQR